MLAADINLCASNTRFAQLEVQRGIFPFGGATLMSARQARLEGEAAAIQGLPPTVKTLLNSDDAAEGLRAMQERRPGVFKGY